MRDALAALRNLETLLKSPRVGPQIYFDLFPELFVGLESLRAAFMADPRTTIPDGPRDALRPFALEKLDRVERSMRAAQTERGARGRLLLERELGAVMTELDACVELLDLTERAACLSPTELSLGELVRVALEQGAGISPVFAADVFVDLPATECGMEADAHVTMRLVALAVSSVYANREAPVAVVAECEPELARITIRPARPEDARRATVRTRIVPRVPPTDTVFGAVVTAMGGSLAPAREGLVLTLPRRLRSEVG